MVLANFNSCSYELPGAEVLAEYKQGIHKFLDMNVGVANTQMLCNL